MKKALVILALAATASTVQAEQIVDLSGREKCFDFEVALRQNGQPMLPRFGAFDEKTFRINGKVVTVKCSYDVKQAIIRTQEEYDQLVAAEEKRREENILAHRQKGIQLLKGYGL